MCKSTSMMAECQDQPQQSIKVPLEGVFDDARGDEKVPEGSVPHKSSQNCSESDKWHYYASREKRLADVPVKYRKLYQRAWSGSSRKAAIRAQCLECVGWLPREVKLCTAPACPLYKYRLKG